MFAPCVGMAVLHEEQQLRKKLQACGKRHDWAVVSLYLLSYDKFLTNSILTPFRWTAWGILSIHILLMVIQEPPNYDPSVYLLPDFLLLMCTIVDVLNVSKAELTVSSEEQKRGSWRDYSKLVALGLLSWMYYLAQWNLADWGMVFFVGTSSLLCGMVHLLLANSSSSRKD